MRWPLLYALNRYVPVQSLVEIAKLGHCHGTLQVYQAGWASGGWPAANRAIYIPFVLEEPMLVTEANIFNGTSANTGSWDVGVYAADGTRVVSSGAVLQAGGTSSMQTIALSTRLDRGVFYMALMATSGSTTVYRNASGAVNDYLFWGALQEATGGTLPATATFASNPTAFLPYFSLHSHSA